jgi:hypothetical protein
MRKYAYAFHNICNCQQITHADADAKQMEECAENNENDKSQKKEDKILCEKNRRLRNKIISLQASQKKKGRELRNMKRRGV